MKHPIHNHYLVVGIVSSTSTTVALHIQKMSGVAIVTIRGDCRARVR